MTSTITHEGLKNNLVDELKESACSVNVEERTVEDQLNDPDVACVCVSHKRQWRHMDIRFILLLL